MSFSIVASTLSVAAALNWGLKSSCESSAVLNCRTAAKPPARRVQSGKAGSHRRVGTGLLPRMWQIGTEGRTCALHLPHAPCTLCHRQKLLCGSQQALHGACGLCGRSGRRPATLPSSQRTSIRCSRRLSVPGAEIRWVARDMLALTRPELQPSVMDCIRIRITRMHIGFLGSSQQEGACPTAITQWRLAERKRRVCLSAHRPLQQMH